MFIKICSSKLDSLQMLTDAPYEVVTYVHHTKDYQGSLLTFATLGNILYIHVTTVCHLNFIYCTSHKDSSCYISVHSQWSSLQTTPNISTQFNLTTKLCTVKCETLAVKDFGRLLAQYVLAQHNISNCCFTQQLAKYWWSSSYIELWNLFSFCTQ